ncbi:cell envelope integrity EipB family protein [Roseibium litorale]|uniref:Cell envelope integrity EipB family protein n=1 Tax=Roseibium litorale TaxID=2803841 RepID=A0ABR9CH63_9HYPH|nr:cell envelope integrity EipB family protein [Roseibium litorale]MBD8890098.1 cell envelope integrity EipB family protein [Roseibium litorale]
MTLRFCLQPRFRQSLACAVVFGAAAFASSGSFAATVELVPHRAIYDLELGEASDTLSISALSGRMAYEVSGSVCEGYAVNFRFMTDMRDEDGGSQVTDLRSSSHETGSADAFQFLSETFVDRKLIEETRGSAKRMDDGGKSVELKVPAARTFLISNKALFPAEHIKALIEAAKAGEHFFTAGIFDGSETGDKVFSTTAVIGAAGTETATDAGPEKAAREALAGKTYWPVTVAYFEPGIGATGEQEPSYQLSFLLYENGISRKMTLDYGDFTIKAQLNNLEVRTAEPCTN